MSNEQKLGVHDIQIATGGSWADDRCVGSTLQRDPLLFIERLTAMLYERRLLLALASGWPSYGDPRRQFSGWNSKYSGFLPSQNGTLVEPK